MAIADPEQNLERRGEVVWTRPRNSLRDLRNIWIIGINLRRGNLKVSIVGNAVEGWVTTNSARNKWNCKRESHFHSNILFLTIIFRNICESSKENSWNATLITDYKSLTKRKSKNQALGKRPPSNVTAWQSSDFQDTRFRSGSHENIPALHCSVVCC